MRYAHHALAEIILARLSRGAVPVDGMYGPEANGPGTGRKWVVFERASLDPPLRDTASRAPSSSTPRECPR
jgi:hypothetical protein